MCSGFKHKLIKAVEKEIELAKCISADNIAHRIEQIGFCCLMCGKCCRQEYGDNSVIVFPEDIDNICLYTGYEHGSVAQPPCNGVNGILTKEYVDEISDLIDEQGNIHVFGWELCHRDNGDCIFIQDTSIGNRCIIYGARPMLCSTYPFYMENGDLMYSRCEGIGENIGYEQCLELASRIIHRYLIELRETLLVYKNYEDFERGTENINMYMANIREGIIKYIVHDSTGNHRTERSIKKG